MGVSMDSFMQALLVELPSTSTSTTSNQCNSCIVVSDNARLHPERWSRLSRRLRLQMSPGSEQRKKKAGRTNSSSSTQSEGSSSNNSDPCAWRWMAGSGSGSSNGSGGGGPSSGRPGSSSSSSCDPKSNNSNNINEAAIPAPPCCPQRKQSIEVGSKNQLQRMMPRVPQRQQSIEISSGSGHSHNSGISGNTTSSSRSSIMPPVISEEPDMPLSMPERQMSAPFYDMERFGVTKTPVPTMSMLSNNRDNSGDDVQLAGQSFTKVIKRTRASLLDDDDEDDSDDEIELHHPLFFQMRTTTRQTW